MTDRHNQSSALQRIQRVFTTVLQKIPKSGLKLLGDFPSAWCEFYIKIPTYCDEKSSQYLRVSTTYPIDGTAADCLYETMLLNHYYDEKNDENYNINQQCNLCHS